jgi:hypothetical protein
MQCNDSTLRGAQITIPAESQEISLYVKYNRARMVCYQCLL